jgi:hypothetical protein
MLHIQGFFDSDDLEKVEVPDYGYEFPEKASYSQKGKAGISSDGKDASGEG